MRWNEPRPTRAVAAPRASAAFTLLEVLAAVAVLAILYTVLARVSIQGLRAEGEADRRVRASLLADSKLAELEGLLLSGQAVPLGETDEELDEFLLHVSVAPLEIDIPPPPEEVTKRRRGEVGGDAPSADLAGSLFAPVESGQPPPTRRIEVRVAWSEGFGERAVMRTTFGLDGEAALPLLEALDAAQDQQSGKRDESDAASAGDAAKDASTAKSASSSSSGKKKQKGSKSQKSASSEKEKTQEKER